ncbi:MAG: lipopolysaccharide heptosyltransferase II [Acidaminococcaceae bacterium]|nr:lipopolysaccharide heptosyltransferase II [Acidaminococcaceae bacterium]
MTYKNILIIKMSSLGDVLHTLPAVAALRKGFPDARLTWLVHPQFSAFVPDPPIIDEVIYFDKVKFKKMSLAEKWSYFWQMRDLLHSRHFDLVIDMHGLFKSAVLAAISGCDNRIGFCEMWEGSGFVSKPIRGPHAKGHAIEQYLDVVRYLGCKVDEICYPMPDLQKEWQAVIKKTEAVKEPYVVLVPGARWETKKWPPEHFAKLAQMILQDGKQVILAGGPEDAPIGAEIAAQAPGVTDLTGKTGLRELGALIQHCEVYISGDTGPLFIASAMKKPSVALYGPTRPGRTGPYKSSEAVIITTPEPCRGCLKKQCSHWTCMRSITPEAVYNEYKKKAQ